MSKKREKFIEPWKEWAKMWKKLKHPTRPCRKNIQDYEKYLKEAIKGKKSPKALVFGATPEIRDLLACYPKVKVTIVDSNLEMIIAMTELMHNKKETDKEIWVKSNWLSAPLRENEYDVLFGDYILENVLRANQPVFFKKAHRLLKFNGYFLTRFYADFPESKTHNFNVLLKEYLEKGYSVQNFEDFWTRGTFYSNLNKNYKIGTNLFFAELKKYIKDPRVKRAYKKAKEI